MRFILCICTVLLMVLSSNQISGQTQTGSYFSSFDGVKIYYEVKGEGKPVILIHGFIVNSSSWKRAALYNDLLSAGFKVITIDMRGNGLSDKPHNPEAYAADAEAKDIMGIAKSLGITNYDVVGYSRGAILTARLLELDPSVNKAVMGGIGIGFTDPEWPRRKMFYRALMGDSIPELQAMVKNVQTQGLDQLALAYLQKEQPSTSKEVLGNIKKKVLLICGKDDGELATAKQLSEIMPSSFLRIVPGDHGGAVRTKEFSDEVLLFLTK